MAAILFGLARLALWCAGGEVWGEPQNEISHLFAEKTEQDPGSRIFQRGSTCTRLSSVVDDDFVRISVTRSYGIHVGHVVAFGTFASTFGTRTPLLGFGIRPCLDGSLDQPIDLFLSAGTLDEPSFVPQIKKF